MAENKPSKRAQYIKSEQVETRDLIDKAKTILGIEKEKLASQQKSLDIERELNKLRQEYGVYTLNLEKAFEDKISSTVDHIDYLSVKLKQMREDNKGDTTEYEEQCKQLNNSLNLYTRLAEEQEKNAKGISNSTREHAKYLEQLEDEHRAAVNNLNLKKEELSIAEEELENAKKSTSIDDAELKAAKEKVKAKKEEVAAAKGNVASKEGKYKKAIAEDEGNGGNWADALKGVGPFGSGAAIGAIFGKNKETPLYEAIMSKRYDDEGNDLLADKLGGKFVKALSPAVKALEIAANAMNAIAGALDEYVKRAAQVLSVTQGQTNAYLYGYRPTGDSGKSNDQFNPFGGILQRGREYLGGSTIITQEEYLNSIKSIASQGIAEGLETAALLTSIAEKTVPQFSATSDYVRRLVLLGEQEATQRFFGLESILQSTLNHQFGETSYLNKLFDSVNANLLDAMNNLSDALTASNQYSFMSTVQQWLSYLYEQGVDQSTVSKISNSLNALGSGNISQVASDSGMQKLLLLSMDRANMDYATILQNGLSASAVDTLMSSMVNYLKGVVKSTKSNNVLESAYANLFGLSMTDMYALGNLNKLPTATGVTQRDLEQETKQRLYLSGENSFTTLVEKIDNLSSNAQFDFGTRIAESPRKYGIWRGAMLAMNIGKTIADNSMLIGKIVGKIIQSAGGVVALTDAIGPAISMIRDVKHAADRVGSGSNSVLSLYEQVSKTNSEQANVMNEVNNSFKSLTEQQEAENAEWKKTTEDIYEQQEAEEGQDDEVTRILKEVEKTLMKNENGNLAIAVSVQAMNDEVLRSFASIFADEDSMEGIFKDKKTKNKLFNYEGDETDSGKPSKKTNTPKTTSPKPFNKEGV